MRAGTFPCPVGRVRLEESRQKVFALKRDVLVIVFSVACSLLLAVATQAAEPPIEHDPPGSPTHRQLNFPSVGGTRLRWWLPALIVMG